MRRMKRENDWCSNSLLYWYDMYTKKDRVEEYVTEDKINQIK